LLKKTDVIKLKEKKRKKKEKEPVREAEYMMAIKCCLHGQILDLQTLLEFKG
jgi:hypothetical protein